MAGPGLGGVHKGNKMGKKGQDKRVGGTGQGEGVRG